MIKVRIGQWIVWIGLLFFITYNTLFGWNKLPINESEEICDSIFKLAMNIGLIFMLLPIVDWYFDWVKKFYRQRGVEKHDKLTEFIQE